MAHSPDQSGQTWGRIRDEQTKPQQNHTERSSDSDELFVRDPNATPPAAKLNEQMEFDRHSTIHMYPQPPNRPENLAPTAHPTKAPAYHQISSDEDEDEDDDKPLSSLRPRVRRPPKPAAAPRQEPDSSKSKTKSAKPTPTPPKPTAAKPISARPLLKNDMQAKLYLIREIEKCWGKDFIKAYIPKCHRPLTKRRNGKRSVYRTHETDPKNWLPSVLKAVLMVARQTNDKRALKKAMNEVVRYRIKNTGNRKPQLVTTDFDVIEDVVVRGWDCEDSFKIRYKHLLMAQSSSIKVSNEEVERIMYPDSDYKDTDDEEEDAPIYDPVSADEEQNMGDDEELGENEEAIYIQTHPFYPPKKIIRAKSTKPEKTKSTEVKNPAFLPKQPKERKQPEQSQQFGGYGPPPGYPNYPPYGGWGYPPYSFPQQFKGYGQPPPYGYPSHDPYSQHGGYPPRDSRDPHAHHPGSPFPMQPYPPMTPPPSNAGGRNREPQEGSVNREHFSPFGHSWGPQIPPYIKQESYPASVEDRDALPTYQGDHQAHPPNQDEEIDMDFLDEKSRLELEAAEAEARLARMRANAAKASRAAKNRQQPMPGGERGSY